MADANLKHWGGSNHLLVPTGVVYDMGQVLRVEETDSAVLKALMGGRGCDATEMLPTRARKMMSAVGASARYFGYYGSRMFWQREADIPGSDYSPGMGWSTPAITLATGGENGNNQTGSSPTPVAVPTYELRRLLVFAREKGEPFSVTYTRLPDWAKHSSPAAWRDYVGSKVTIDEEPAAGTLRCTAEGGAECSEEELSFASAPAPPYWLRKILVTYPVPLFPESDADPGSEVHCSA